MMRGLIYLSLIILMTLGCSAKVLIPESSVPSKDETFSVQQEKKVIPQTLIPNENRARQSVESEFSGKKTDDVVGSHKLTPHEYQGFLDEEDTGIRDLLDEKFSSGFDIPIVFNEAVKYFINYFTTEKRKVFANWLKRSEKYVPIMREILKEEGLPEDLVYLAMIESGFNPKAYSPAKASGPWQFIYKTGERYGLKVDYWVDERRDPEKSTVAAARYLKDLFNQFGCWYLAAASYNVGERKVERVLEQHNTRDIWELIKYNTLPRETREYIPKLIAAAIIAKNPEEFGFEKINYDNPIRFLKLKVPKATPLKHVAEAAGVNLDMLRAYNPEILRGITPPDKEFVVKLPQWVNEETFKQKLSNILSGQKKLKGFFAYRVKKTDTVTKISARYGITKEMLCLWNSDKDTIQVKPGRVIYIPRLASGTETYRATSDEQKVKLAKYQKKVTSGKESKKKLVYYKVKKGDTLLSISNRYGVSIQSIKSINNLKEDRIYTGMTLKLAVEGK